MNFIFFICLFIVGIIMPLHAVKIINHTGLTYAIKDIGVHNADGDRIYYDHNNTYINQDDEIIIKDINFLVVQHIHNTKPTYFIENLNNSSVVILVFDYEYNQNDEIVYIPWKISQTKNSHD